MNILLKFCRTQKEIYIFFTGLMLTIGGFMFQQDSNASDSSGFTYAAISFTPDSQKLVFNRSKSNRSDRSYIHILDLKTKALSYYQSPTNQSWYAAKFSPSGKQVVFVMAPRVPGSLPKEDKNQLYTDWGNAQIAIMDADGRNVRLLTNTSGYKMAPNFSWSGKKVLFTQGEMRAPGSKSIAAGLDAYEIDLESGNIQQLTDFKFFQMGRPSYLPGDEQFVAFADGPSKIPGVARSDNPAYWRNAEKKHNNSQIYVFNARSGSQELEPLFSQLFNAGDPVVDAKGNLYFMASDGRTLRHYQSMKDGVLRNYSFLSSSSQFRGLTLQPRYSEVAPDGSHLAVVTGSRNPSDYSGIFLLDFATDRWEEIHVPVEARLINP